MQQLSHREVDTKLTLGFTARNGELALASLSKFAKKRQATYMNDASSEVVMVDQISPGMAVPNRRTEDKGLIAWRMKRVCKYIDQHLANPITLMELANIAGLSRMYFAAQFRRATGIRPHEFLLQRRVERSQEMLVRSELPIIQIALDTGFETQSHYSVVFKRLVGITPARWRELQKNRWSAALTSEIYNDSAVLERNTGSSLNSTFASQSMR